MTRSEDAKVPKAVSGASAFLAAAAIFLGEHAAGLVKGAPVSWEKFSLICLVVCVVLPFQIEQVFKKK
jgi:hypothetical protein